MPWQTGWKLELEQLTGRPTEKPHRPRVVDKTGKGLRESKGQAVELLWA